MVQRCKFSIELKNFPPDLSGEPRTGVISTIRLKRQDTCGLLRARITQVVGECIVEFTGVDVCRIEVAELYVEESIQ